MMNCKKCNAELADGAKFCDECGEKIDEKTNKPAFCGECGKEVNKQSGFCSHCGVSLNSGADNKPTEKNSAGSGTHISRSGVNILGGINMTAILAVGSCVLLAVLLFTKWFSFFTSVLFGSAITLTSDYSLFDLVINMISNMSDIISVFENFEASVLNIMIIAAFASVVILFVITIIKLLLFGFNLYNKRHKDTIVYSYKSTFNFALITCIVTIVSVTIINMMVSNTIEKELGMKLDINLISLNQIFYVTAIAALISRIVVSYLYNKELAESRRHYDSSPLVNTADGWTCTHCGQKNPKSQFMCRVCGKYK
jgi:hypothetical protein